MQTDLTKGTTVVRNSAEATAIRTAEVVGGSTLLHELIDLSPADLEGRDTQ